MVTRSSPAGASSRPAILRVKAVMSLVHPLRQGDHLLAGRGEGVAAAVALEELGPERLLDLAEAAEHGGVVDAEERGGGAGRLRTSAMALIRRKSSQARFLNGSAMMSHRKSVGVGRRGRAGDARPPG